MKMLPKHGYALVEEELPRRELDDDILSKENEILQQQLKTDDNVLELNSSKAKKDFNFNYLDDNNNNNTTNTKYRNKSALNVEMPMLNSCPGLATSTVTYKLDWRSSWRRILL